MNRSGFRFIRFTLLGLSLGLTSACGLPGPGSSTSTDPEQPPDEPKYEDVLRVRIETNEEMRTSWHGDLFNLMTPEKAWALSGLTENNSLADNDISVINLDENFQDRGIIGGFYNVEKSPSGVGYDLLFQVTVEKQLNRVIRVQLPNNEVMYAPLYKAAQGDNIVTVNVASHYVLKKLYDAIDTRSQLEDMLACGEKQDKNTNCSHQSRVKIKHIRNLIELVHEYDLEITSDMTVQDAVDLFDATLALRTTVETGIQEIVREISPVTHGTARAFSHLDGYEPEQLQRPLSYNSTMFDLDLATVEPESPPNRVNIGVSTSRTIPGNAQTTPREDASSLPVYPHLTHSADFVEIRTDSLAFKIPFTRSTIAYAPDGRIILSAVDNSDTYQKYAVASIDSFLSTEGNIMAGSVPGQHVDMTLIGWQSNPVYKQLYRVNQYEPNLDPNSTATNTPLFPDSAPWLVSANVIKAENYAVTYSNTQKKYVRDSLKEDRYVMSWQIHGEETETDFTTSEMSGKTYGVLSYDLQLGDSNPMVQLTAETQRWEAVSGTQLRATQPEAHYRSRRLSRSTSHVVTGPTLLPATTTNYSYGTVQTIRVVPNSTPSRTELSNRGLITLGGGLRPTTGHASNNGSHFSLVLNKPETLGDERIAHRALIVGTELYRGPGNMEQVRYMLQGNTMGLSSTETRLANLNQSTLIISNSNNGCEAELTVRQLSISHDIAEATLGMPKTLIEEQDPVPSLSCTIDDSEITLVFEDTEHEVLDQRLTLTGFFTKTETNAEKSETDADTSNLINLLWLQNDNMGLVFATRDQQLDPAFPNQPIND